MAKHPEMVKSTALTYAQKEAQRIKEFKQAEIERLNAYEARIKKAKEMVLEQLADFVSVGFTLSGNTLLNAMGIEVGTLEVADIEDGGGPVVFKWSVREPDAQIMKGNNKNTSFDAAVKDFGTAMGRWMP